MGCDDCKCVPKKAVEVQIGEHTYTLIAVFEREDKTRYELARIEDIPDYEEMTY